MGFEGLLFLVGCHLPRSLCYWLATCVVCETEELVTPDGFTFPLSKAQVHWILGLPHGPNPVPNRVKGKRMKKEIKDIWQRYGSVTAGGTRELKGKSIVEVVDNPADKVEFKRAFLMFALNGLCPATSYRLSLKLLPAVTVFEEAQEYDWCSLVLDHLLHYLKKFDKKFSKNGFAKSCGGCTYYLAVLYLDRLRRPPLRWGIFPRIKVWVTKEVNKAKSKDRIRAGNYGKLGCLDAAYGYRHPREARDSFPSEGRDSFPSEHECSSRRSTLRATHQYYANTPARSHLKKRNKATNGNPYERKLLKRMCAAEVAEEDPSPPATPVHPSGSATHVTVPLDSPGYVTHETGPLQSPHLDRGEPVFENLGPVENETSQELPPNHTSEVLNGNGSESPFSGGVNNVVTKVCDQFANLTVPLPSPWSDWGSAPSKEREQIDQQHRDGHDPSEEIGPPPGFENTCLEEPNTPQTSQTRPISTCLEEPNTLQTPCPKFVVSASVGSGPLPCNYRRSRQQRVIRPSVKVSPGYMKIWRPVRNGSLKMKLARVVRSASHDSSNNPVFLECNGVGVRLHSAAAAVVSLEENLSLEYVDVISVLYTKVWATKWNGCSRKIMLSPWFACDVLHTITGRSLASESSQATIQRLLQCQGEKINVVFVPVWEKDRWWAVAFSFNRQEIRVMDPSGRSLCGFSHTGVMVGW